MLSVITRSGGQSLQLSSLLSDLVPGAVQGLIRDVLVLDPEVDDPQFIALCEDAGACRVSGGLDVAVRQARSDLILLAAPGLRLDAFALDRLGRNLAERGAGAVSRGLALTGPTLLGLGFLASPRGLVASRRRLMDLPASTSLEAGLVRASRGAPRLAIAG
jgi:hypothetical protein